MQSLASEIALTYGKQNRLVVLLDGEMGAGKTQFTHFFVGALGGGETSSPSFAIHHSYPIGTRTLDHFDLFRLQSEDELEATGFWDFFRNQNGIIIIEWAERLRTLGLYQHLPITWPKLQLNLEFVPIEDSTASQARKVTVLLGG